MKYITAEMMDSLSWRLYGGTPLSQFIPGPGLVTDGQNIRLAQIDGVAGQYVNPVVVVDDYGRVVGIQDGVSPGVIPPASVESPAELETYSGESDVVVVLNNGDGRAALYLRDGAGQPFNGPAYLTSPRPANGVDGIDGAKGDKGDKGDTGERGPKGDKGDQGDKGDTGATGTPGTNGTNGIQGMQGETGAKGDTGAQGIQGPEGKQGATLIPNAYGVLDEDRVANIRSRPGDYFFLVDPAGDLRVNKDIPTTIGGDMSLHLIGWNGSYFTDYGQLTGAQGVRGLQGVKGEKGDPGQQGIQGPQGTPGERGATGLQGIQGAKGDKGDAGAKGDTGLQGIQGVQGPAGPIVAGGSAGQVLTKKSGANGDVEWSGAAGFRGVMYNAAAGQQFLASTNFQPVNMTVLTYNAGGLNFRPSGTASNAIVVPDGVKFIRLSVGIAFISNNVEAGRAFHASIAKNGAHSYPGSTSHVGTFPYTNSRFSFTGAVLSVSPGDVFTLMFATSTPTGQKTLTELSYFAMEVIG